MKRNVSSQIVGAQMVDVSTGGAFAGAVSVYVTGDGGTQAIGSVGSGVCTAEGNGFFSYAPTQAETNYDHVAFTFIGTGAIPATVQIYTTFPQTGDNFARLGAPAGASFAADIVAVKAQTGAIETDTQDIQARIPAALVSGRMDSSVGVMAANTLTASALATDAVTEIHSGLSTLDAAGVRSAVGLATANLDTQLDAIPTAAENTTAVWAAGTRTLTALDEDNTTIDLDGSIRSAMGLISANLDTQLAELPTADEVADEVETRTISAVTTVNGLAANSITASTIAADAVTELQSGLATASDLATVDTVVDAIKARTDNLPDDPADASDIVAGFAGLDIPTVDDFWDEEVDGTTTARQSMRLANATLGGKASGLATTTAVYRDLADTKDRVVGSVDANGNRTAVTLDLT